MGKGKLKRPTKAKKTDASIKKVTPDKKSKGKSRGNPVEAMQPVEAVKCTTENKPSPVEINPQTHHSLFSTSWLTNTNTPSDRKIVEALAKFCNEDNAKNEPESGYKKIAKDLKVILGDNQPIERRSEDITALALEGLITALEEETTNPTLKARFDRIINANAERAYALDATCSLLNLVIYQEFSPTGTMLYLLTKLYQHYNGGNQQNCLQIGVQRLKDLLETMKSNDEEHIDRNRFESCLFPDRSSLTTNSSDEKEVSSQTVAMTGCA